MLSELTWTLVGWIGVVSLALLGAASLAALFWSGERRTRAPSRSHGTGTAALSQYR